MKRPGNRLEVITDRLRSYPATMKEIGNEARHGHRTRLTGRLLNLNELLDR